MWRTIFLAVGIALAIFGGEFLIVERAVWAEAADDSDVQNAAAYLLDQEKSEADEASNDFHPEPWVPWAMLSSGAVIVLYCVSLPKD